MHPAEPPRTLTERQYEPVQRVMLEIRALADWPTTLLHASLLTFDLFRAIGLTNEEILELLGTTALRWLSAELDGSATWTDDEDSITREPAHEAP
jgi:hypothetical protein